MSTELAVQEAYNPLSYLGVGDGEPLKPVRLSLTQPINADADAGTIAGRWLDNQSNFQYTDLNLVVLEVKEGRVMFESQELGSKPLCKSDNGIMPKISDDLQRQDFGKGCAKCPMSQWKKVGGRSIKPQCQNTSTVLGAQLETGFTYRINAKGQATKAFLDAKETIRKFYLASKAKGKAILPTEIFFKLSSIKVVGGKGTYYVAKFGPPVQITDPTLQEDVDNIFHRLVVNRGKTNETEEEEGEAGAPQGDPVSQILDGQYEQEYEAA